MEGFGKTNQFACLWTRYPPWKTLYRPHNQEEIMQRKIRKAAVIGSGVMGGGIAALLAGAGIKTLLLDIVPPNLKDDEKENPQARNSIAKTGLDNIAAARPALLMQAKDMDLISIGNLEDDFDQLATCDWIVEVVVENLSVKHQLFQRIEELTASYSVLKADKCIYRTGEKYNMATVKMNIVSTVILTVFFNRIDR